jgi:hypothetical protein
MKDKLGEVESLKNGVCYDERTLRLSRRGVWIDLKTIRFHGHAA